MIGLYFSAVSQTPEQINGALDVYQSLVGKGSTGASSEYFIASPASHDPTPPTESGESISCLSPLEHESISGAVFVPPIRSFRDNYSLAMIALVYNAVEEGGLVLFPFVNAKAAKATGYWSLEWLREVIGREYKVLEKSKFVAFRRDDPLIAPESVFAAVTHDIEGLANAFMQERDLAKDPEYLSTCSSFLADSSAIGSSAMTSAVAMMPDVQQGIEQFLKYATYSVTGAAYKTESIRRFIAQYMPRKRTLNMVDIGGGMGFVDIELLLTCPLIQHLTNCEPVISTLPVTKRLVSRFEHAIQGRFHVSAQVAQDFAFDQPIDVLTDFASLLYMPREELVGTLDRAWAALRPGGIFIIHENIKRDIFKSKSYYEQVFEIDELEGYLGKYGQIDRYRSSDIAPIAANKAGDQTIFRVVQKSANA